MCWMPRTWPSIRRSRRWRSASVSSGSSIPPRLVVGCSGSAVVPASEVPMAGPLPAAGRVPSPGGPSGGALGRGRAAAGFGGGCGGEPARHDRTAVPTQGEPPMRAFSLFLIAVGAILTFAVTVWVEGVELRTVGVILMIVGAIGLVLGLMRGASTRTERSVSGDGRTVVEDQRTTGL